MYARNGTHRTEDDGFFHGSMISLLRNTTKKIFIFMNSIIPNKTILLSRTAVKLRKAAVLSICATKKMLGTMSASDPKKMVQLNMQMDSEEDDLKPPDGNKFVEKLLASVK